MKPLTWIGRLFETADEERVRVVRELAALRAQVVPKVKKPSMRYDDSFSDQKIWQRIGKLEKRQKKLDEKIAKRDLAKRKKDPPNT